MEEDYKLNHNILCSVQRKTRNRSYVNSTKGTIMSAFVLWEGFTEEVIFVVGFKKNFFLRFIYF